MKAIAKDNIYLEILIDVETFCVWSCFGFWDYIFMHIYIFTVFFTFKLKRDKTML